jgi:D-tyrosyl-tRNA(Tyr) deacylase
MRALVQRVLSARVEVAGTTVGEIGTGLLVLLGVTHGDTAVDAEALARKIFGLRVMRDERGIADLPAAGVLAVSQFTLYGDVGKGRRPSWTAAAPGRLAEPLFDRFVTRLRAFGATVETGTFGADMQVDLVNDGPVTILLER